MSVGVAGVGRVWKALGFAAALALAAPLAAQAQRDPLNGAFGALEIALPPADALDQVEKMAASLNAIAPQRPGVVDTYILAVSLWNDPVFEREAKEAAAILGRRFDAADRTIILSAGTGAGPRAYPTATPNNIQAALGRIGKTINPAEDLVIVFFTSHGGEDGAVAIQETNRMGGALRPLHLRSSLQQAGIRTRVVIVSACYSGHFILPFSDADTVVLTAAAADKPSFGCEPSRDWTYFGDAFFNHGLRGGGGLIEGYNAALGLISEWEADLAAKWRALPAARRTQEPEPLPSNPQKNVGERAEAVVAKAEAFGIAASCAGHVGFALDRARAGRVISGLDAAALEPAKSRLDTLVATVGAQSQRTQGDVARAITASVAAVSAQFAAQPAIVTQQIRNCAAQPAG